MSTLAPTYGAPVTPIGDPRAVDQPVDRFFGAIVQQLLPVVAQTVPHFLQMFQSQHRDLGVPEDVSNAQAARDLGGLLAAVLPTIVNLVPTIVEQLEGERDLQAVTRDPQAYDRFLGSLIKSVVPTLIDQLPGLIQQFAGNRDGVAPQVSNPEGARFFGAALGLLIPAVAQALPGIIDAVTD